jgi:hypothetical protein
LKPAAQVNRRLATSAVAKFRRIFNQCTSSNDTNLLGRPVLAGGAAVVAGGTAVDNNGYGCEACYERISLHKRLPASEIEKRAALDSFLPFVTSAHYAAIHLLDNQSFQRWFQHTLLGESDTGVTPVEQK